MGRRPKADEMASSLNRHFPDSPNGEGEVPPSRALTGVLARLISSSRSSFALLVSLLAVTLVHRIQLTLRLFSNPVRPFDFDPTLHPPWFMLSYFVWDLTVLGAAFLAPWLFSRLRFLAGKGWGPRCLTVCGVGFLHLALISLAVIHVAHDRLLFNAQSGLDSAMVLEVYWNIPLKELLKFVELRDVLFMLFPIVLFWVVWHASLIARLWVGRVLVFLTLALCFGAVVIPSRGKGAIPSEIGRNPVLFLGSDMAQRILGPEAHPSKVSVVSEEPSGVHPAGSAYLDPVKPAATLPPPGAHPWNVVFFIMESVGTRYTFDTSQGNRMPMPFLHRLSRESWHLKRHYTTSNISTKAMFSLLSGLYDFFGRENFGLRPDANVPSIYNFLSGTHDGFLVTPSAITWYFPVAFAKNSGLPEMHHYGNLKFRIKEEFHTLGHYIARDEIQTVDFFIQRLSRAREPFLGIYISFTAHLPYFDYGPDYRLLEEDGRSISRYYNNLVLLDRMIERIYESLREKGLLERTIFVIVGDHGQAFGQHHPDNFMHHRYSYNENLETPAILHQPALFKPKVFDVPTSHVDLLPTLLDAMRVPYDPLLFDGESLFRRTLRRKHLFFYGHEESISSLGRNDIKIQFSLKKNRCWAFDLKADPDEKNALECSNYPAQLEALRGFVSYHDESLVEYNAHVREGRDFNGHRHPSLRPRISGQLQESDANQGLSKTSNDALHGF